MNKTDFILRASPGAVNYGFLSAILWGIISLIAKWLRSIMVNPLLAQVVEWYTQQT
jgi:hypothetical protein